MIKKRYCISIFILLTFFLTGCVKETLEDCVSGLKLRFDFSLHTETKTNLFGDKLNVINVYCFDEQEILRHVQQGLGEALTNDYVMDVNLKPGKYTIISWGSSHENFNNSFKESAFDNQNINEIAIDKTTLSQFRVMLNTNAESKAETVDNLFYGAAGKRDAQTSIYTLEQVEVRASTITERTIELINNTNILDVTFSGIENIGLTNPQDIKMWVTAQNGEYLSSNSIENSAKTITYTPKSIVVNPNNITAEISILRMDMLFHTTSPILLHIETPDGRKFPSKPIDVVGTLRKALNTQTSNYIYNFQSDFDRIYRHPIEVRIGADLEVRIFINDWEITHVKPV